MRGVALQSVEGIPLLGFRANKVPTRAVVPRCVTSYAARHGGTQPRLLSQAVQPPALRERHRQQPKRLLVSAAAEPAGWERTSGFRSEQELVRVSSWQSTTVVRQRPDASATADSVRGGKWKDFQTYLTKCAKGYTVSRIKHQCKHISAGTNITR